MKTDLGPNGTVNRERSTPLNRIIIALRTRLLGTFGSHGKWKNYPGKYIDHI
jgi:hypothetical protein